MGLGLRAVRACLGLLWPPLTSPEPPSLQPRRRSIWLPGSSCGFCLAPFPENREELGPREREGDGSVEAQGGPVLRIYVDFYFILFFLYNSLTLDMVYKRTEHSDLCLAPFFSSLPLRPLPSSTGSSWHLGSGSVLSPTRPHGLCSQLQPSSCLVPREAACGGRNACLFTQCSHEHWGLFTVPSSHSWWMAPEGAWELLGLWDQRAAPPPLALRILLALELVPELRFPALGSKSSYQPLPVPYSALVYMKKRLDLPQTPLSGAYQGLIEEV